MHLTHINECTKNTHINECTKIRHINQCNNTTHILINAPKTHTYKFMHQNYKDISECAKLHTFK